MSFESFSFRVSYSGFCLFLSSSAPYSVFHFSRKNFSTSLVLSHCNLFFFFLLYFFMYFFVPSFLHNEVV